jgi:hypothetical protein
MRLEACLRRPDLLLHRHVSPFTIDNITRILYVRRRVRRRKPGGRIGVREMEKRNVREGRRLRGRLWQAARGQILRVPTGT